MKKVLICFIFVILFASGGLLFLSCDFLGNDEISLKTGSYQQVASYSNDGVYCDNNDYYNTIIVKENNKFDLFARISGALINQTDISYKQNENKITANILGSEFFAQVVDEKTLIVKDGEFSQVFCYQEQLDIRTGSYYSSHGDSNSYHINIKENSKLDIAIISSDYTVDTYLENLKYEILGNVVFLEFPNEYYFLKIEEVQENYFYARLITRVALNGDYYYNISNGEFFNKATDLVFGTYIGESMHKADGEINSYEYAYNVATLTPENISIGCYLDENDFTGYSVLENLNYKPIGNIIIVYLNNIDRSYIISHSSYISSGIEVHKARQYISQGTYIDYKYIDYGTSSYENGNYYYVNSTNLDEINEYYEFSIQTIIANIKVELYRKSYEVSGQLFVLGNRSIVIGENGCFIWYKLLSSSVGKPEFSVLIYFDSAGNFTNIYESSTIHSTSNLYSLNSFYQSKPASSYHGQEFVNDLKIYDNNTLDLKYRAFYSDYNNVLQEEFCEESNLSYIRYGNKIYITSALKNSTYDRKISITITDNKTVYVLVYGLINDYAQGFEGRSYYSEVEN